MVKQRNLFDPNRIDILADKPQKAKHKPGKELIEAHNASANGLKMFKKGGNYTGTPLFSQAQAEKQVNLF